MKKPDLQYLGKFIKLFSFKGELIMFSEVNPDSLTNLESIFIDLNGSYIPYNTAYIKPHKKNNYRLQIKGINNEADAKNLLKKEIYISNDKKLYNKSEDIPFNIHKNFNVFNNNDFIGKVFSIINNNGQCVIEVQINSKMILIPLVNDFIEEINPKKEEIKMILPEGLLDL
jgi:16S rRNA processing protein RimM